MKVVMLVPGTGNFHCGSCLRDHTLVRALRRAGVDATMASLYLPWVTDQPTEADAAPPIFFGGVNVYLRHKLAWFGRAPRWLGRLLDAAPLLRATAAVSHMTRPKDLGELTVAMLRGERGGHTRELDRLVQWINEQGDVEVVLLNNVLLLGLARRIGDATGAAVACTLHGEDGFLDALPEPYRERAWAELRDRQADADAFIAVSRTHGKLMAERMAIDAHRLHVVYNGIELDGLEPATDPPDPPTIGYLARLCPAKGLDSLIDAYIEIKRDEAFASVKLAVAGAMTPGDRRFVDRQRAKLNAAGLADDATLTPNLSRADKCAFLRSISVLSVPATYGESFGLYVLEAWAAGVPVVQPDSGAFGELLALGGGGKLHASDDPAALAAAWGELLADLAAARALGAAGRRAVHERFTADHMAAGVRAVFESIANRAEPIA